MRGPLRRWRERGGRLVALVLPFDDVMDFALALLALSPSELEALGWSFADRKRLLDHFLASGREAQRTPSAELATTPFALRVPVRDIERLRRFVHRALPRAATNAAMLDRVGAALDRAMPVRRTSPARRPKGSGNDA